MTSKITGKNKRQHGTAWFKSDETARIKNRGKNKQHEHHDPN